MVHRRLGAVARVSWGFPHIWPEVQVPFPLEFIPPALSPRLPDCGGGGVPQTSAGMPSAASRMGVEALPGAFPAAFSGERVTGVSNARGNPGAVLGTICRDMGGVEVRFQVEYEHVEE